MGLLQKQTDKKQKCDGIPHGGTLRSQALISDTRRLEAVQVYVCEEICVTGRSFDLRSLY